MCGAVQEFRIDPAPESCQGARMGLFDDRGPVDRFKDAEAWVKSFNENAVIQARYALDLAREKYPEQVPYYTRLLTAVELIVQRNAQRPSSLGRDRRDVGHPQKPRILAWCDKNQPPNGRDDGREQMTARVVNALDWAGCGAGVLCLVISVFRLLDKPPNISLALELGAWRWWRR
jgi:hypothetical protein